MKLAGYARPSSLAEAYALYRDTPGSVLLGGCTLLNRREGTAALGIDLCDLGIGGVYERDGALFLGAMATFSDAEHACAPYWNGTLPKAIPALGAPLKNIITLGGTVAGRLGMSDLLTALLALDARVHLFAGGILPLETYLAGPPLRDIVTGVSVRPDIPKASFLAMRNARAGPPLLHAAVAAGDFGLRVAIGARPGRARLCPRASECAVRGGSPREAARLAAEETLLGNDMHATGEYRRMLCETLVERALLEAGL